MYIKRYNTNDYITRKYPDNLTLTYGKFIDAVKFAFIEHEDLRKSIVTVSEENYALTAARGIFRTILILNINKNNYNQRFSLEKAGMFTNAYSVVYNDKCLTYDAKSMLFDFQKCDLGEASDTQLFEFVDVYEAQIGNYKIDKMFKSRINEMRDSVDSMYRRMGRYFLGY